ncbi:hypothetical protein VII00023_18604 [Vibrio ichthyoenteri ATCC 700023]|uniref:Uncharacterized protein n=1 Tax=Vibrio ichthyoenteri ATCC 700023 TaxID=870968 RepID=F9S415_9VIBR|nr:hypothetical protein [Vibrio ichthyoenteri]EGU37346.1 hypothetical protein VII00023_18604 [Vibrio ichthyoenteri ATCC 700023]
MTKRLCKLNRTDIAAHLGDIHRLVTAPKYLCRSCARSSSDSSVLCKPAAIPPITCQQKPIEEQQQCGVLAEALHQQPLEPMITLPTVDHDMDFNHQEMLPKPQYKQAKKQAKKQKKYVKKLEKVVKEQQKLLKKHHKLEAKFGKMNLNFTSLVATTAPADQQVH